MKNNKYTTLALLVVALIAATFFGCDNRTFEADSFEIVSLTAPAKAYTDIEIEVKALVRNKATGVPAPSQTVTFKTTKGIIQATAQTDEFGIAKSLFSHSITDTLELTTAQIEASIHQDVKTVVVELQKYSGEYEIRKITASPDTIYADDNITTSKIKALVVDKKDGIGVHDLTVRFKSDCGRVTSAAVTDSSGVATAKFYDNGDGPSVGQPYLTANITAIVGPEEAKVNVYIKEEIKEVVTLTANPKLIYADNNISYSTVRAKVVDKNGFAIVGKPVDFKVEPIGEITAQVYTNELGIAETHLYDGGEYSDTPVTITAQVGRIKAKTQITIAPVPDVHKVVFDAIPESIGLEQVIHLRATATDIDGRPVVDGTLMQFDANLGIFEEQEAEGVGNKYGFTQNGRASVIWNSGTRAGNASFIVTCAGRDTTAVANITPDVPAKILLSAQMRVKVDDVYVWEPLPVEGLNVDDHSGFRVRIRTRVLDMYDNSVLDGIPIQYETNLGSISAIKATDTAGEAYAEFNIGKSAGDATITAQTLDEEVIGVTVIRITSNKVASISFVDVGGDDETDGFYLDVRGTGGRETLPLEVHLKDVHGNLVSGRHSLIFEITRYPVGSPDNETTQPNINGLGLSDYGVEADNGVARSSLNSGTVSGTIRIKVSLDDVGRAIEATKSNIVVRSGPPATVRAFIGDYDTATNMGGGMWRLQAGAVVADEYGNEVIDGTVVHFSLGQTPPPPRDTSISGGGYVGNESDENEDGDPGVAYTHLIYNGNETNEEIKIIAESGGIKNTDTENPIFKLPINQPNIELYANPRHVNFGPGGSNPMDTNPKYHDVELIVSLTDGQGNKIANSLILITSSHGELRFHNKMPSGLTSAPEYVKTLPGPVGLPPYGERGKGYGEIRLFGWICPAPGPDDWMTMTDVQVTAALVGTDSVSQTQISAYRYQLPIPDPGR